MASNHVALLCLLGLLLTSSAVADFSFYYLVLMWPGAYCVQSKAGCCMPTTGAPANDFFVAGLTTYNVRKCNNQPFYINQLDSITNELYAYWSNIKCPSNNGKSTWKSAWKNYGVCTGYSETEYFQVALDLRAQVNPLELLAKKGIYPDYQLYSVEAIKEAIAAGIGVTPAIQCSKGPFGKFQLYQIHICVDKDAETFIDCPVYPKFTCSDEILFHPFRLWMLNTTAKIEDPDFELSLAASE